MFLFGFKLTSHLSQFMYSPSPKGRSPRVAVTFDDENAPPTASIMDGGFGAPDPAPSKLTHRVSDIRTWPNTYLRRISPASTVLEGECFIH